MEVTNAPLALIFLSATSIVTMGFIWYWYSNMKAYASSGLHSFARIYRERRGCYSLLLLIQVLMLLLVWMGPAGSL